MDVLTDTFYRLAGAGQAYLNFMSRVTAPFRAVASLVEKTGQQDVTTPDVSQITDPHILDEVKEMACRPPEV